MFGWNINDASTDNLRDIIELNWPQKDETTILGPMFHGTDASLINISETDL